MNFDKIHSFPIMYSRDVMLQCYVLRSEKANTTNICFKENISADMQPSSNGARYPTLELPW